MTATPPASQYACPDCHGQWLAGYTFDHAAACPIRTVVETQAVDDRFELTVYDRVGTIWRPATWAEIRLAAVFDRTVLDDPEPQAATFTTATGTGFHVVTGQGPTLHSINPDRIAGNTAGPATTTPDD